jgi:hypothetical protein
MTIHAADYEALLSGYCDRLGAIALLKQYRPYLEMVPSLRRPQESVITIPLPVLKVRYSRSLRENDDHSFGFRSEVVHLPCDLAILMCDPEWKVKMRSEIVVFIHRPDEDFSQLIRRWRQSQVYLEQDYEWIMPPQEQHMLSEGGDRSYPLFVLFEDSPSHLKRGLAGAGLPYIVQSSPLQDDIPIPEVCAD